MVDIVDHAQARRTLSRVRMRQVALMLAIKDLGTLTAAAAELGMTQPAATKMLQELEAAMEHRLFERSGRHLVLTPAGQRVVVYFSAVRGTLATMNRDLASLDDSGERLSIGSIMAPSPTLLSRAIVETRRAMPSLSVHVTIDTSDRLLEHLERGETDIVIGRLSEGYSRREYRLDLLEEEALAVVVSVRHPLARKRRVRLAELAAMAWVLQPRGSPIRELLEREFSLANIDMPIGRVETAAIFTTANLVEDSDHVAVLPLSVARPFARHGMLAILPVALRGQMEPYGTIVRRGRPLTPGAQFFLATIHKAVAARSPA